jgi:hypothetical protein
MLLFNALDGCAMPIPPSSTITGVIAISASTIVNNRMKAPPLHMINILFKYEGNVNGMSSGTCHDDIFYTVISLLSDRINP